MKRKLLFTLLAGLSFTLGACSLGGDPQPSALPWGQSSAPIFGSSSSSSSESKAAYTVTFYVEGRVYATQEVKKGYQVTRPEDPYIFGYKFRYWADERGTRWNFATDTVWNDISLYAVFTIETSEYYSSEEPYTDHTVTLFGDFTSWQYYGEYKRYSYNGFPMVWNSIRLNAGSSFAFHVQYSDGNEYNLGWSNLFTNGCPGLEAAMDTGFISTMNEINLSLSIEFVGGDHKITVTGWEIPEVSSDYSTSSEGKDISVMSMHLTDPDGVETSVYPISPTSAYPGELGRWEGYYVPENYSVRFQVTYADGGTFVLTYNEIDPKREWMASYTDNGEYGCKFFFGGKYTFAMGEDLRAYILDFEPDSSSSQYSSESTYSSGGSSASEATITFTILRYIGAEKETYTYYESEGYPFVWEDINVIRGDVFYIEITRPIVGTYHYGWASLDSASASSGVFTSSTGGDIQVLMGGPYNFTFDSNYQLSVTGWETGVSSGSYYSSSDPYYPTSSDSYYPTSSESTYSSDSNASTITLFVNRDNWTRTDEYRHYESEGYPFVWENLYLADGDEFYIMLRRPNDPASYSYGWTYLDDASATSGYFAQTGVGILAKGSGTYTISFTQFSQIVVTGWENSSSSGSYYPSSSESYYPSSSESYYPSSSESYYPTSSETTTSEASVYEDGWYLVGSMNNWAADPKYYGVAGWEGNAGVWKDIYIEHGETFCFVYSSNGVLDWENAKRWSDCKDVSGTDLEGLDFVQTQDGAALFSCTRSGWYEFYLSGDYQIYIHRAADPSSSSEESSSYVPSPGYYLICNDNQYTLSDDYVGVPSTDAAAVWENYSFGVGDAFMIRHVFEDGHTFDLGYSELLDNCEAYDVVSQYEGTSIRFQESGDYKIVLLSNESILIAHADAESLYNICTLNFYVDNALYDTRTVTQGFCPTTDTFAVPPTKDGYFFDHWEDAEGNTWSLTTTIPHDLDLYAVFVHTYTITLDLNGGSYETTTLTAIEGYNFNLPTPTAPLGMDFDSWLLNDERIEEGYHTSYDYGQDITLVAQYVDPYWLFETDASNLITKYNVEGFTSLDIPAYIRGNNVAGIASGAFQGKSSLEQVNLPNTITTIGDSAFADCTNLSVICFNGTLEEWANVSLGASWAANCAANQVVCTDGAATI